MPFHFKKKPREYSLPPQFYVEFLGCLPCRGIRGSIYTNSVAYELIERQKKYPDVPRMTLQVTPNEIKFRYKHSEDNSKDKTPAKYPSISMQYVMYVSHMDPPNADIANCIYLSYNPTTNSMLHTHVYRFDSSTTAEKFVKLINQVVESSYHQAQVSYIEERLRQDDYLQTVVEKPPPQPEYIEKVQRSPTMTAPPDVTEDPEPEPDDYISPEKQNMQALASELKEKLQLRKGPILLPPKDYDTVHRKQGRLENISSRKCLNEIIVGHSSVEASASGDISTLSEQNEDKESNNEPIYYPVRQGPEDETVYPPTSVGSPPIMRRKENYIRRTTSFLSSSSDNDQYYRAASYAASSQNSPSPVTNRRPASAYESYPTLKSPERSPVNVSNPDIFRYKKPLHTRESSMSSIHSGLSSHSDHSQRLSQVLDDGNLEIPPDYDQTPKKGKPGKRPPKDEHLGYNNSGNQNYYDPHRAYDRQGPSMVNANPQHNPAYAQSRQDPSALYNKPIKRIAPVQR